MKILLFIIFTGFAFSQTIKLNDFLEQVKQNHPLFSKEKRSVEIEEKNREAFLGSEDWNLTASPFYTHVKPIASGPFTPKTVDNIGFEARVERLFWSTGGTFAVAWNSGYINQNVAAISIPGVFTIPGGPGEIYQHGLYFS